MGLYVSTTGSDVVISELGITISHPTVDQDLSSQFSPSDIQNAPSLTSAIRSGLLVWRKRSGGAVQPATDYDEDYVEIEKENTGTGAQDDRVVTFKDLAGSGNNFSYTKIANDKIITIPTDQQMVVFGDISIDGSGELDIDGETVIMGF